MTGSLMATKIGALILSIPRAIPHSGNQFFCIQEKIKDSDLT
jgi:hypothetical protein